MSKNKAVTKSSCNCVEDINKLLVENNMKISQHLRLNLMAGTGSMSNPSIETCKLNKVKRGAIPLLFCTYCPFCGVKYQ